jgi:hypothetical protein
MTANFKGVGREDVLLGRGSGICDRPGNKKFRNLVEEYRDEYSSSHRREKNRIGNTVLNGVQSNGGRFLAFDGDEQEWKEVPRARALEKSMQALREQSVRYSALAYAERAFISPNENKEKQPTKRKRRLSLKTPKKTGTTTAPSKITPTPQAKEDNKKQLKSPPNNGSKKPCMPKSFHTNAIPAPTSQIKFRALFPLMNNRMRTTSTFLPSPQKRRFTTGHPPPTDAWKPCPQDTAAHDMDEMRLLLQEIHSEELRREKYKYIPETPPTKKNKKY